jgi:hypothetical protein
MATIINADTSDGLKLTSDTSGQIDLQSAGSTKATIDTSGNLKFNSGYGSVSTAYGCRAWVNFNGTGTLAIRDSGNVSSVTDNGVGNYTVNFATNMPDVNYSVASHGGGAASGIPIVGSSNTTTLAVDSFLVRTVNSNTFADLGMVCVAVFR